jgi:glycosyltransferase involved in cell wall biosynthesis
MHQAMKPLVSVLLPVRDAVSTLSACLDSIANQSLARHEVIAVDDGSSDGTSEILSARADLDPRIRFVKIPPTGLVGALNYGLSIAQSSLVARMDADDWMHPRRLQAQFEGMAERPDCVVLGTRVRTAASDDLTGGMREYLAWQNACVTPLQLAADVFLEAPFTHPAVMFRRAQIMAAGGYRSGPFPEDYELWLRLHANGARFAKLSAKLLHWRQSSTSLSRCDPRYSRASFDGVRAAYLSLELARRQCSRVAVWGAGRKTRRRVDRLLSHGIEVTAWIDIDARKIGNRLNGVPVVPPVWLRRARRPSMILVYVATHGARQAIADYLAYSGYVNGDNYLMVG